MSYLEKFFIIAIILGFGIFLLNLIYRNSKLYNKCNIMLSDYITGVPTKLKVVNLGSTYAKFAFESYDELYVNGFNFALEHQTLDYDLKILKYYCKHLSQGCTVIIPVAACLMLFLEGKYTDWQYYTVFKSKDIPSFSWKNFLKYHLSLVKDIKKIVQIIKSKEEIKSIYEIYPMVLSDEQISKNLKQLIKVWKNLFDLKDLDDFYISERNSEALAHNRMKLQEIISFCQMNGFKPVIVVPPFSECLNGFLSVEFVDRVLTSNLVDIPLEIPILDYRKKDSFQCKTLYVDGGFRLNRYGSKLFMKQLLYDLMEKNIISWDAVTVDL